MKEFKKFLIENKALENFVNNTKFNTIEEYLTYTNSIISEKEKMFYVQDGFKWDETKEGVSYWMSIDNKWDIEVNYQE